MVKIRPLQIEFAPLMVAAARESIAEVEPWMPWCSNTFDQNAATDWIRQQIEARANGSAFEFAFFDNGNSYIGGGGINRIDHEYNCANVGYWIRSSQTRRGYGTQALKNLAAWAHDHTELNRLEIVVAVGNLPSQKVAQKAGALKEGVARSRLRLHGQYHDAVVYSLVREA